MRTAKQLFYGALYLIFFGAIAWGIYAATLKPAPTCFDGKQNQKEEGIDCGGSCVSCAVKNVRPLSVNPALLLSADRVFSAVTTIRNSNVEFGTKSFDYEVNFYDSTNRLLRKVANKDFIYPGETKKIIEAGVRIVNGVPKRAEFKLINQDNIKWESRQDLFAPSYNLQGASAKFERENLIVSGFIANVNSFELSRAVIAAFAVDTLGVNVGVSETELNNIKDFEVKDFEIIIPIKQSLQSSIDKEASANSIIVEILK